MQRTCILMKPDALTRGICGEILTRFEKKGFRIIACKLMRLDDVLLREHYAHVAHEPFFEELTRYMTMAPVLIAILEGDAVIEMVRIMTGKNMNDVGTVRGEYATSFQRNILHSSDSPENAEAEIARFFHEKEIFQY